MNRARETISLAPCASLFASTREVTEVTEPAFVTNNAE